MRQLVVAEGIEREETIATLGAIGVQYGQGFLLGRPQALPAPAGVDEAPGPMV